MESKMFTAYICDQIVFEDGIQRGAIIVNNDGRIHDIIKNNLESKKLKEWAKVIEITEGVLMPGIVDSHVHINSPGRSEWEDFPHATKAAAAGGVTTLADMPLNSIPPTTTLENLKVKVKAAKENVYIDVAFWGGVIPNNHDELLNMINAGCIGFKCFLCPSGVDEFPSVNEKELNEALKVLEETNALLAFHAECELDIPANTSLDREAYDTYLSSRPPEMEHAALKLIKKLSQKYNKARYHIVHVSAASVVEMIENIKNKGISITAETCPHYLTLNAENILNGQTEFKCAPPIRSLNNKELLWESIKNGKIDMIVSDHSPCTSELKNGGFLKAWGGISSLQFGLSLIWTEGSKRGLTLVEISKLLSASPAKLCQLNDKKGMFKVGLDADFIVFNTEETFIVNRNIILHKNKLTPYLGMKLKGKVYRTYLRGKLIYDSKTFSKIPQGKLLLKDGFE